MFPSSTVENYIKVIHAQQVRLTDPDGLVPMGHLAMGMGVTPGTATTMVKALADSGLVHYAPYAGVRLTRAGERLAGMVIRRHRLIELFLVQVIGLRWDEVHDEAEKLEHVVSERLIERMDEMLGHPQVDPHGDPIPDADGTFPQRELHSLLTCPLHVPVTVMRVADQDASFLRFVESHHLKPGQQLAVDARDEVADSVSVHATGGKPLTIGARAASKLLVEVIAILVFVMGVAGASSAQTSTSPSTAAERTDSSRPFEIEDNSFFVEEAFNQEAGRRANDLRRRVPAGQRVGPRTHAGMAGAEPAPPALVHDSVLGRGRRGRHRRYRAELSLPAPRGRAGTPGHRASPLAAAAERRSIARPGGERSGPAGESAGQQAGPRLLLPRKRGTLVEAQRGFRYLPVRVTRAGTRRDARHAVSSAAARSIACARW